jgi:predicted aspartyl protease
MITGSVNARFEIVIKVHVEDSARQEHEVETVLDTGFTGSLTLPPSVIPNLNLPWRSRSSAVLANGNDQLGRLASVHSDSADRQCSSSRNGAFGGT